VRRTGLVALALVVALAGAVGLIAFFQSRDEPELSGGGGDKPGAVAPDETEATLARGNVVLTFREPADERGLQRLAEDIAGPPEPELVDAGQAVIVERRADQAERIVARAYKRRLAAQTPEDPALREFVEAWLGQGGLEP
jgi:Protein of unknown function (DUF3105)